MSPICDIVLITGAARFSALEQSNLAVAHKFLSFSESHPLDEQVTGTGRADMQRPATVAPDLGQSLVTLTRNGLSYSLVSRALSSQLGLYSAVISEGKGG